MFFFTFIKIQKQLNINCSCFDVEYPIYNSTLTTSCLDNQTYYDCSIKFMASIDNSNEFKDTCENQCPMECDRIEYDYIFSGNEVNHF